MYIYIYIYICIHATVYIYICTIVIQSTGSLVSMLKREAVLQLHDQLPVPVGLPVLSAVGHQYMVAYTSIERKMGVSTSGW